jgi:hypothetical protein
METVSLWWLFEKQELPVKSSNPIRR